MYSVLGLQLRKADCMLVERHPVLRRIEDLADSPLVPALLEKVHLESDPILLKVRFRHLNFVQLKVDD